MSEVISTGLMSDTKKHVFSHNHHTLYQGSNICQDLDSESVTTLSRPNNVLVCTFYESLEMKWSVLFPMTAGPGWLPLYPE